MTRIAASLGVAALLLTACTPIGPAPDPEPEAETAETVEVGELTDGPVQDTWIFEQFETVTEAGLVDVTAEVVDGLQAADTGVDLPGGATFFPLTTDAAITDDAGRVREDLDVVAGITQNGEAEGLQVIATPRGDRSVDATDLISLDLSFLDLPAGAPLIAHFAFGQGLPAGGDDPAADGVEMLLTRMQDDRFQWYAIDGDDNESIPGVFTVLGSVPVAATAQNSSRLAQDDPYVNDAVYREGDGLVLNASNGGDGGIPAKAKPALSPLGKLAMCTKPPIKCISDYFKGMEGGAKKSADDIFNRNFPPSTPPSDPCYGCGGGRGEPHMTTFDQHHYDLQLVGEFVLASSPGFEVQMRARQAAEGSSVSSISAIAVDIGGQRFTLDSSRDVPLWHEGEPVTERPIALEAGEAEVFEHQGRLELTGPDGARVLVNRMDSAHLDVLVDPGVGATWEGLLGSPDGSAENDLTARGGQVLPLTTGVDELYGVFGDSWRISDAESLFDYGPGESTATYTDLSFPTQHVTLADLDPGQVAIARILCQYAGITEPQALEWCIFDYAATGAMSFIRSAVATHVDSFQQGQAWAVHIPNVSEALYEAAIDQAGHVLITTTPSSGPAQQTLLALDGATGETVWEAEFGDHLCVAVTDSGQIAAASAREGGSTVEILDPADGSARSQTPTSLNGCDSAVTTGETVILRSGSQFLSITDGELGFEGSIEGFVAGPAVSEDGRVWAVAYAEETGYAYEIDPKTGPGTPIELPLRPRDNLVGTAAGFAVGVGENGANYSDKSGGYLFFPGDSAGSHLTPFPLTLDDWEQKWAPDEMLSFDGQYVATYASGEAVAVLDAETGELLTVVQPTSFENNDSRLAIGGGVVTVGPFGGSHWVEAYDARTGDLAWSFDPELDVGFNDAKRFGPSTADGRVVVQTTADGGIIVALAGAPGRG